MYAWSMDPLTDIFQKRSKEIYQLSFFFVKCQSVDPWTKLPIYWFNAECQMKRYPCYHHVLLLLLLLLCYLKNLAGNSNFDSEKFRIFGGKFKRKNVKFSPKPKSYARTKNFHPNLKLSPEHNIFTQT